MKAFYLITYVSTLVSVGGLNVTVTDVSRRWISPSCKLLTWRMDDSSSTAIIVSEYRPTSYVYKSFGYD